MLIRVSRRAIHRAEHSWRQPEARRSRFMVVPRHVLGGAGFVAPNERLNVAGIGAGGMGGGDIATVARLGANIVALCDVDDARAAGSFQAFPKAHRYKDFRVLLEKEG